MKGTLFSADFIKDSNNNLRLLEFNTDTSIIEQEVTNINWNEFIGVLSSNSINKIDIVYKPIIHQSIVNHLSESLHNSNVDIIEFNIYPEDVNSIYPTAIEDSSDKFILRLAYDESAIFDSTYCKNKIELFKLYTDSNQNNLIVPFYYSSSVEEISTLEKQNLNILNVPDVAIKNASEVINPISFYKIGSEVENETTLDRWNNFIENTKFENCIIEEYLYNSSSVTENNKLTSIRSVNLVYGSNLDVLNLHTYRIESILALPDSIPSVDLNSYVNEIPKQHYYEFTTNFVKMDTTGILSSHRILKGDDTYDEISNVAVGDSIKSYFISGSPQIETNYDIINWSSDGKFLPSGSYLTSSLVVFKDTEQLRYGGLIEYKIDGDSVFSGTAKKYLVYDSASDATLFRHSTEIDIDNHYFYDIDGNLIDIDEANFYLTSETNLTTTTIDIEEADTFIISGSTSFNSLITHNAPCFVAGTKISLLGGEYKNVEDINIDDIVLSYNFEEGKVQPQKVKGIGSKQVNETVIYTFEDGSTLRCTLDHPLYSHEFGWISKSPEYTLGKYGLTTKESEVGFKIHKQDGSEIEILDIEIVDELTIVYNVNIVEHNHNFFANEFLVHNRSCFIGGTEITLHDGDIKLIENVVKGDLVLTFNELTKEIEPKLVYEVLTPIHNELITIVLEDGSSITSTTDHPYYSADLTVKSFDVNKTMEKYNLDFEVGTLSVGDSLKTQDGELKITDIILDSSKEVQTYLLRVEDNHNYFANGVLVHNK